MRQKNMTKKKMTNESGALGWVEYLFACIVIQKAMTFLEKDGSGA